MEKAKGYFFLSDVNSDDVLVSIANDRDTTSFHFTEGKQLYKKNLYLEISKFDYGFVLSYYTVDNLSDSVSESLTQKDSSPLPGVLVAGAIISIVNDFF